MKRNHVRLANLPPWKIEVSLGSVGVLSEHQCLGPGVDWYYDPCADTHDPIVIRKLNMAFTPFTSEEVMLYLENLTNPIGST